MVRSSVPSWGRGPVKESCPGQGRESGLESMSEVESQVGSWVLSQGQESAPDRDRELRLGVGIWVLG